MEAEQVTESIRYLVRYTKAAQDLLRRFDNAQLNFDYQRQHYEKANTKVTTNKDPNLQTKLEEKQKEVIKYFCYFVYFMLLYLFCLSFALFYFSVYFIYFSSICSLLCTLCYFYF
jgi:hypothetical protein